MHRAGQLDTRTYTEALQPLTLAPPATYPAQVQAPDSWSAAWYGLQAVLPRFGLNAPPAALRQAPPFPLQVTVSLHGGLTQRFQDAAAPQVQSEGLLYAALVLVDSRPAVLLGGLPDRFHTAFHAARPVGSVAKLFLYDIVWHQGYVRPEDMVTDGDMPEALRRALGRPVYVPDNNDKRVHGRMRHRDSLSRSINKIAYRTTWGERTDTQRRTMVHLLVKHYALPWHRFGRDAGRPELQRFYQRFLTTESVPLGTWSATPWEVAGMLEAGFRGVRLSLDHVVLSWNGRPHPGPVSPPALGLSPALAQALLAASRQTAAEAVVPGSLWRLAAKTGTTDGGRDAWIAGFLVSATETRPTRLSPRVTVVVWAGYADNRPADLYGGAFHGPIFHRLLRDPQVQALLRALTQ